MEKYKVAVIVAGIDEAYQDNILTGLQRTAKECNINFYVFASFTGVMNNASHDAGELNIFNLPDFNDFDGAVLLTNTIDYLPAVNGILGRIYEAGIPAVSIDNDIKDFLHVGIDNKTAMREITEHFINVHGFKTFNYISGPADNSESAARLEGFLEVLKEHDLTIETSRIYYGDFRAPSGNAAIEAFRKQTPFMPEAIICANDVMAAAAMNSLFEAGFKIPEEIAISGFDNAYGTHNLRIDLTTVERPLLLSGKIACRILAARLRGEKVDRSRLLKSSPHFTQSCGCTCEQHKELDYKEVNISNFSRIEMINRYTALFNQLSRDLLCCSTFEEYITRLKEFIKYMNPEEFYFCVCKGWDSEFVDDKGTILKNQQISTEYTDEIFAAVAYSNEKFYDGLKISRSQLIPDVKRNHLPGQFYYFLPLHFGERCLGYMVINNSKVPLHNATFQSWCITINNSLENIRKLICLDCAVKKLGRLYARDSFSGIYNRNGFVQHTEEKFRECAEQGRRIMLMFIDLDGLKVINDTFGHDIGDYAIRAIADVLTKSCDKDEVYCRFGGDEFIVFASDYTEADAIRLTQRIDDNIAEFNSQCSNSFVLSASTGYVIAVPKKGDDLFRFVTEADKVMYEEKRKKKRSNYLKSE